MKNVQNQIISANTHPHKKKYRHYPLKCAIHPRLKEAGEFLHNKVKLMGDKINHVQRYCFYHAFHIRYSP